MSSNRMMRLCYGVFAAAAIAALASALGSAQVASAYTFQRVLDAHYARECIRVHPNGGSTVDIRRFPVTVELDSSNRLKARERNTLVIREFDALQAVGLLRVEETTIPSRWLLNPKPQVPAKRYHLMPLGKQSYQAQGRQRPAGFCVGYYQVDAIKGFSKPRAMSSRTISEVTYVYSPQSVPSWAADAQVQAAMPDLARKLLPWQVGKGVLIKTSQGWVHEQDFND